MNRTVLTERKAGAASGALHSTLTANEQAENERKAREGCNASEPFVRAYWRGYALVSGMIPHLPHVDAFNLFQDALDVYSQAEKQCALDYANHALTEETREEARIARVCCLSLFNRALSDKA